MIYPCDVWYVDCSYLYVWELIHIPSNGTDDPKIQNYKLLLQPYKNWTYSVVSQAFLAYLSYVTDKSCYLGQHNYM